MARPLKPGLDYFPFDVNFFNNDKIQFVSALFSLPGENIIIKLLCKIYSDKGYYCKWSTDEALLFAKREGFELALLNEVVEELVKRGFFNKDKFSTFRILTSKGIQDRYVEATARRLKIDVITHYWINGNENEISTFINEDNDDDNTQSKVEESKEEESKQNETKLNQNISIYLPESEKITDVEEWIINEQEHLNALIKKTGLQAGYVLERLHLFHLELQEHSRYPVKQNSALAGFEKYLINSFNRNRKTRRLQY